MEIVRDYIQILRGNSSEYQHNMSSPDLRTAQSLFMNIDYSVVLPETSFLSSDCEISHKDIQYADAQ